MKSQFAIFGLERTHSPDPDDEKSGQPYLFRKYPEQFASSKEAHGELEKIMKGESLFPHFTFKNYVILEVYTKIL